MSKSAKPSGMFGFGVVWLGQIISVLASSMTTFGMTLWMYKQTESATAMGMMQVAFITPFLLLSPIAGAMVDRYNRKLMMMLSDLGAVLSTTAILILYSSGSLEFWHLYIAAVINGLGNTFQWPAYSAAISTMIPKEQYGRANGLMSLMEAGPGVLAPMLAGALLAINIDGVKAYHQLVSFEDRLAFQTFGGWRRQQPVNKLCAKSGEVLPVQPFASPLAFKVGSPRSSAPQTMLPGRKQWIST